MGNVRHTGYPFIGDRAFSESKPSPLTTEIGTRLMYAKKYEQSTIYEETQLNWLDWLAGLVSSAG
jgi:hypothetical protein